MSSAPQARHRVADAALHVVAMVLMVAGMVSPVLALAALWGGQGLAAVLLRRGWRVHGSFVDLIAASGSIAVPLLVGAGHGHGGGAVGIPGLGLALVIAAWLLARVHVGVRGLVEWLGVGAMGLSMLVMLVLAAAFSCETLVLISGCG